MILIRGNVDIFGPRGTLARDQKAELRQLAAAGHASDGEKAELLALTNVIPDPNERANKKMVRRLLGRQKPFCSF